MRLQSEWTPLEDARPETAPAKTSLVELNDKPLCLSTVSAARITVLGGALGTESASIARGRGIPGRRMGRLVEEGTS